MFGIKEQKVTFYLAADSTVRNYEPTESPQAGWGQFISEFLTDDVAIENHAVGGRSSKTFITEGRLDKIIDEIASDDCLFIQFGHNDSTMDRPERYTKPFGDYKLYLQQYIDSAKAKNAIPILVTPVGRLHYVNDQFQQSFEDYCTAMKEVAKEHNVLLIDLMADSIRYFSSIGFDNAKELFMISINKTDCTHFTEKGAKAMSKLVSESIKKLPGHVATYVK